MGLVDILSRLFRARRKGEWVRNQRFRTFVSYEKFFLKQVEDLDRFAEYVLRVEYYVGSLMPEWVRDALASKQSSLLRGIGKEGDSLYSMLKVIQGITRINAGKNDLSKALEEMGVGVNGSLSGENMEMGIEEMRIQLIRAILGMRNPETGETFSREISKKVVRALRRVEKPGEAEVAGISYDWDSSVEITKDTLVLEEDGEPVPTEEGVLAAIGQIGMEMYGNRKWGTRDKVYVTNGFGTLLGMQTLRGRSMSAEYRIPYPEIMEWLKRSNEIGTHIFMLTNQAGEYGILAGLQPSELVTCSIVLVTGKYGKLPIFLDTLFNNIIDGLQGGLLYISHLHTDHANAMAAAVTMQAFILSTDRVNNVFAADPFKVSNSMVVADPSGSRTSPDEIRLAEKVMVPAPLDASEYGLDEGILYIQGNLKRAEILFREGPAAEGQPQPVQRRPGIKDGKPLPIYLFLPRGEGGYLVEVRTFPLEHGFPDDSRVATFKVWEAQIVEEDGGRIIKKDGERPISQIVYAADGTPRDDGKIWKLEGLPVVDFSHLDKEAQTYVIFSTFLSGRHPVEGEAILRNRGTFRNRIFNILKRLKDHNIRYIGIGHHPLEESVRLSDVMWELYQRGGIDIGGARVTADHVWSLAKRYGLDDNSTIRELTLKYAEARIGELFGGKRPYLHFSSETAGYAWNDRGLDKIHVRRDPHWPALEAYSSI